MDLKPVKFVGSSRDDLRKFPHDVKHEIGIELMRVQSGLMPTDFKPMMGVGAGAYEIRVQLKGAWRAIYVAKFKDAIYVLHAFKKTTQQTPKADIDLAAQRYKLIGG